MTKESEIQSQMFRLLSERGVEVTPEMTVGDMIEASKGIADSRNTNIFCRHPERGLYLESYTLKACLKEAINVLYASKQRFGASRKGGKSYLAERVFPVEDYLYLGRQEPDDIILRIIHTSGPRGPQSSLTYNEVCDRPQVTFHLKVTKDAEAELEPMWPDIWTYAEENGWGAVRSQGYDRFDLTAWDRVA